CAAGIEVMNPTPVDWRNDRTRVELPHGQPDGEDPQEARTREEVLAGGTRLFEQPDERTCPDGRSHSVTDLSDRIAERSPRAARWIATSVSRSSAPPCRISTSALKLSRRSG